MDTEEKIQDHEMNNICNKYNISISTNIIHKVHFQNEEGIVSGNINKDGRYKTILKTCEMIQDELVIELTTNSDSKPKIQKQECYRLIISILCLMILLDILWIINWIKYFTLRNGIHLLLTLSFIFFTIEKVLHIIDYKARYEFDKIYTITIVRCAFIGLSRFTFFMANFLLMLGFEINYRKPNFLSFVVSLLLASSYTVLCLYNSVYYLLSIFITHIVFVVLYIFFQIKQLKSSKSFFVQTMGSFLFFI